MMRVETIGDATLYLGDCRDVLPGLGRVDAVVTDPPYGMAFQSNHRVVAHDAIANDRTTDAMRWACEIPAQHSSYVFCRWDNLTDIPKPRSVITWVKNNWSMGDLAHEHGRQTELICFYPGPAHSFKSRPSDVISFPRTNNDNHPTEKPVGLMWGIVEWTDGCVFDPFMGSGTTGVACARLGRRFIGIEIEERHFSIACRRIEAAYKQGDLFIERGRKNATPETPLLPGV